MLGLELRLLWLSLELLPRLELLLLLYWKLLLRWELLLLIWELLLLRWKLLLLRWEKCLGKLLRLELLLLLRLRLEFLLRALLRLRSLYWFKRLKLGKSVKALNASKLRRWLLLDHLGSREPKHLALLLMRLANIANWTRGKLSAGASSRKLVQSFSSPRLLLVKDSEGFA